MAENPVIGENVLCSVGFPVSLFFLHRRPLKPGEFIGGTRRDQDV